MNITSIKQRGIILLAGIVLIFPLFNLTAQKANFTLNDLGVFKKHGVEVMIYNDSFNEGGFFDEKVNGIQMIQHGVRTVTGGAVRLSPTPEQWDLTPTVQDRIINVEKNSAEVTLFYDHNNFSSKLRIEAKESGILITTILDKPLPAELIGKAGMHIEFLPAAYFKKTYFMDNQSGICPLYPAGPMSLEPYEDKTPQWFGQLTAEIINNAYAKTLPIAQGKKLVLAPDDPKLLVSIESLSGELNFLDGRNLAQNGWYVIREVLPAGKTGEVAKWLLTPNSIPDWMREPVIGHSQAGYFPKQEKIAVIELDKNDTPKQTAVVYKLKEDGSRVKVLENNLKKWGQFTRYNYYQFDFSSVTDEGLYVIGYDNVETKAFPISANVYDNIWHPTLDVWFPVQMDHMFVNEAYRVWHGAPHLDDALQAPLDTLIHDGYSQNSRTDSPYKPLEHIPGLNIGGWFDAGDFDIRTNSHCETVMYLAEAWEDYKLTRDQTTVLKDRKYVEIHRPDGIPDIQQQVEHGTLALIAQYRAVGHAIHGIIVPNLHQYHHLGDAVNMTDNLVYNPKLNPHETDGFTSGTFDDRWAFTNIFPPVTFQSAAALATASIALRGYNDELADESLQTAIKVWDQEVLQKRESDSAWLSELFFITDKEILKRWLSGEELRLTIKLLLATENEKYANHLAKNLWPSIKDRAYETGLFSSNFLPLLADAIPYMDKKYVKDLREQVIKFKQVSDSLFIKNPYGVPLGRGGFMAGNYSIISWALTAGKLHQAFPDLIGPEYILRGLNYLLGTHPGSDISFVSAVGTDSKMRTYSNNRADFSFIAGSVVPGAYLIRPDFYENKEDWPFIWYENETVIDYCSGYIYLAATVNDILSNQSE
ncbi:MAG: glycoside hydrolase family 9 protein [Bacteroidales bacterium]|nr:glycoside hydrolase family 9 protein [Bacteroidales bacterium]